MRQLALTTCFFLLASTLYFAQSSSTTKKPASTASKDYLPVAGVYMAPSTATDSSATTLFLMKDKSVVLSREFNPTSKDDILQEGKYEYDARNNAVRINWNKGSQTQWINVKKDSTLILPSPELTFKLYQNIDSVTYKDGKRLYE